MSTPENPKFSYHSVNPESYKEKTRYLNKVNSMSEITPIDEIPIRPAFLSLLLAKRVPLLSMLNLLEDLLVPKAIATDLLEADQPILIEAEKDYINSLNAAIKRGDYPAGVRGYFGLPLDSDNLPEIKTREETSLWSRNLIDGEAKLVAANYEPMSKPTIDRITNLTATFKTNLDNQRLATKAYTDKENEIILFQTDLDIIIGKCIDDTTTFYNDLDPSMKRKMGRKWGNRYVSRRIGPPMVFNVSIPVNSTVNVADLEVASNTEMEIHNTCLTELYICLRTLETDACTIQNLVIQPGETKKVKASEIGTADNDLVNVTNPSTTREGSCTITV